MSYVTVEQVARIVPDETLVELTDDTGTGAVDEQVVQDAIDRASSEINAYVGIKYAVPVDDPHPLLEKICIDLVVYYLHLRIDKVSDAIQKTYENAVRLLRDIGRGVVSLGVDPEPEATAHRRIAVRTNARIFTEDELAKMP